MAIITRATSFSITIAISLNSLARIINIPAPPQPSIQAGIDSSLAGPTILVSQGDFYENIDFKGENITVASHFPRRGDTARAYVINRTPNCPSRLLQNSSREANHISQKDFDFEYILLSYSINSDGKRLSKWRYYER